jgi:hypothetical protein
VAVKRSSTRSYDDEVAHRLWLASQELVDMSGPVH